eukprot:12552809-Heterocapsa_arctica.AAC.1
MALDCTFTNTTDIKDILGDLEGFKTEHVATAKKTYYPTPTFHVDVLVEYNQIGESCCTVKTPEDLKVNKDKLCS